MLGISVKRNRLTGSPPAHKDRWRNTDQPKQFAGQQELHKQLVILWPSLVTNFMVKLRAFEPKWYVKLDMSLS